MEAYGTGQTVFLGAVHSHGPALPGAYQIFSNKWEAAGWGDMFRFNWRALMTPQKATLDSLRTFSRFVSYRRLAPKFQHSLYAITLGIYLGDPDPPL